ncbi:cytochrome P450 [Pseudonocardia xishanensis]|uniref:Cytochrome P450 n=1 Tax=Pseudonocardia xishanensis TaxID=630995 RepID=A0ABP8RTE7_9PSEU
MDQSLVEHFVEHFDHHDPRLGAEPEPIYAAMRADHPVAHSDVHGGFWVISDYENARYVLQHPELFTTRETVTIPPGLGNARPLLPLELDPPEHVKYRNLLAPVFAPRRIEALGEKIRANCDRLIDAFIDRGGCDLVSEFASPLPSMIFVEMMGLPYEHYTQFHTWKDVILHGHHDDVDGSKRKAAGQEVHTYINELIGRRKSDLSDDIISVLITAEVEGEKLTDEEIIDVTYLLFLAGLDTVTSAISLSFLHLATDAARREAIVADPSLIPAAVEELLRYESLVMAGRTVVEDTEVGGVEMRKGDRVLVNTISANRDSTFFENADEIDFSRRERRHLAFSVGPHRCVGSHLARLELRVAMERFHQRIPDYRVPAEVTPKRYLTSVAGIETLPLEWTR